MFPFKRKPKLRAVPPRSDLLLSALKLAKNLDSRVRMLEKREAEHATAIDKLGERFQLEYIDGEWIGKRYPPAEQRPPPQYEPATRSAATPPPGRRAPPTTPAPTPREAPPASPSGIPPRASTRSRSR